MSEEEIDHLFVVALLSFLILIAGQFVAGGSLETDKELLLNLKSFLEERNLVNKGSYSQWNTNDSNPCHWPGISCDATGSRVIGIDLSRNNIAGDFFGNFSGLNELAYLNLSKNTIGGGIPDDLGRCQNLKFLNLSHNLINGGLNLTGLTSLEVLDLSQNRIEGHIRSAIPGICSNLVAANLSSNAFTGDVRTTFVECWNLKYLDLSTNNLTGGLWYGFDRLIDLSLSVNNFTDFVSPSFLTVNCSLQTLEFSENQLFGLFPKEISNCKSLVILNLFGNNFSGPIPEEIGSISGLQELYLGSNKFSRDIPQSLVGLSNLTFLDLSGNNFGGDIQNILGQFKQVKFLELHGNAYIGGLYTSGVLSLPNVYRLDLSYNNLSGPLPVEVSQMPNLKFLILAYNQFMGQIPDEYGNFQGIQAIDLSFNKLNGSIPSSLGKLSSLLWLMLANNELSGEIPPELGNCASLLWLNLANNQLSGPIPPQLTKIGADPMPTFLFNRENYQISSGRAACLTMKRWIPADYAPFTFVFNLLTEKKCNSLWDMLLTGYGIFPVCVPGSNVRTLNISGYLQLSGNKLYGEVPPEIGNMRTFSMLHLGINGFYGKLPSQIGFMGLVVLNLTQNNFSGDIPSEIGGLKCLQNLDLSFNNFSGTFPASLNNLSDLSKFNISYNPSISGSIPDTGQLATFEKWSYLGDPFLHLPPFIDNSTNNSQTGKMGNAKKRSKLGGFLVFLVLLLAFFVCGILTLVACLVLKSPTETPGYLLEESKGLHELVSTSSSSPWISDSVKVISLDKIAFTHADILQATLNFSNERIIGRGGYGIVYRGVFPDGTEVAIKKLQRDGAEGEKEFQAEMEVLSGNGFGWPHPNLVTLYGWCLDGSERLLVYEYMEGGSLEDHITDRTKLTWKWRIEIAIDVARALVFLHHECYPPIVHRDVKASNVLLDKNGKARVTDFGLARVINPEGSHVSTTVAGTVGYVAPEYGQTWHATTKGDVYSYGMLIMELATGRRAVDGGEECLLEWARRVMGDGRQGFSRSLIPVALLVSGLEKGAEQMCELLKIGIRCTAETPYMRPNMKEVLAMLFEISGRLGSSRHQINDSNESSPPTK